MKDYFKKLRNEALVRKYFYLFWLMIVSTSGSTNGDISIVQSEALKGSVRANLYIKSPPFVVCSRAVPCPIKMVCTDLVIPFLKKNILSEFQVQGVLCDINLFTKIHYIITRIERHNYKGKRIPVGIISSCQWASSVTVEGVLETAEFNFNLGRTLYFTAENKEQLLAGAITPYYEGTIVSGYFFHIEGGSAFIDRARRETIVGHVFYKIISVNSFINFFLL